MYNIHKVTRPSFQSNHSGALTLEHGNQYTGGTVDNIHSSPLPQVHHPPPLLLVKITVLTNSGVDNAGFIKILIDLRDRIITVMSNWIYNTKVNSSFRPQ